MTYEKLIEITQKYVDAIVEAQNQEGAAVGFVLATAATADGGSYVVAATNLELKTAMMVNLQVPGILSGFEPDDIGIPMGSA